MIKDELLSCVQFHKQRRAQLEANNKPKKAGFFGAAHDTSRDRMVDALFEQLEDDLQRIVIQFEKSTSSPASPDKALAAPTKLVTLAPLEANTSTFAALPSSPAPVSDSRLVDELRAAQNALDAAVMESTQLRQQLANTLAQHDAALQTLKQELTARDAAIQSATALHNDVVKQLTCKLAFAVDELHSLQTQHKSQQTAANEQIAQLQSSLDQAKATIDNIQSAPATLSTESLQSAAPPAQQHTATLVSFESTRDNDVAAREAELNRRISALEEQVSQYASQVNDLQTRLEKETAAASLNAGRAEDAALAASQAQAQVALLREQLQTERDQLAAAQQDMAALRQSLVASKEHEAAEEQALSQEHIALQSAEAQLAQYQEAARMSNEALNAKNTKLAELQSQFDSRQQELNSTKAELSDTAAALKAAQQEFQQIQTLLQQALTDKDNADRATQEQAESIAALHAATATLRESFLQERQSLNKDIEDLEVSVQTATAAKNQLATELLSLQNDFARARADANNTVSSLRTQLNDLELKLAHDDIELSTLKTTVEQLTNSLAASQAELEMAKHASDEQAAEYSALEDQLSLEKSDNARLKELTHQLGSHINESKLLAAQLQHEMDEGKLSTAALHEELVAAKERNTTLRGENEALKAENFTTALQSESHQKTILSLRDQIEAANRNLTNATADLEAQRQATAHTKAEYEALQATINELVAGHSSDAKDAAVPDAVKKLKLKLELLESELRSTKFALAQRQELVAAREAELMSFRQFAEQQKAQYESHVSRLQDER